MKYIKLAIVAVLFAGAANAATFHWKDDAQSTDWTDGSNYAEGTAPSANDIVEIGNTTVYLSDSDMDSFNLASSLDRIAPSNNNSKVVFTINGTDEPIVFGAGISRNASWQSKEGTVEKRGAGTLKLTKNTGGYYDFCVAEFHVVEGMVDFSSRTAQEYFRIVRIDGGATLKMPKQTTYMNDLLGEGTLSCPSDNQLRVNGGTAESPTVVEPLLKNVNYNCSAYTRILRTDNVQAGFNVFGGVTEIIDIGGRWQPSPTGNNSCIGYDGAGVGTIRYIGESDTDTGKDVLINNNAGSAYARGIFDAGPHGGITFNGAWGWTTKSWGRAHMLGCFVLKGTNEVPCRINGKVGFATDATNGRLGDLGIIKQGSGAWHLANMSNFFASAVYVDEGELGFASIKEKGEVCALGTADDLKDLSQTGNYSNATDLAYAIRLGSSALAYPADGLATLRYIAATNASCTTRPIALAGDGRIVSDSHKLVLRGVTSCAEGENRLVLSGDAEGVTNIMHDVTDGATASMKTGVVKDGNGTWILTGTNSFSGPLAVNGGRLILKRPSDQYTWYRLVIKDSYYIDSGENFDGFKIGRIGLFDEDGYRQNIGLEYLASVFPQNAGTVLDEHIPSFLEPGQFGWGMPKRYSWWIRNETTDGQGLSAVCKTGGCGDDACMYFTRGIKSHYVDDPDKYLFIDMRLTNGAPEIKYYDIAVVYSKDANLWRYNIKTWSLLGSTDGISWDELHSVEDSASDDPSQKMKIPSTANSWMAQNSSTSGNTAATKHDTEKLQPIASKRTATDIPFLNNVEAVTVANGAVLEADGDITLSKFRVAADGTAGTVKGFALAPNSSVDVTGLPAHPESFDLPITFDGVSPQSANWSLKVGGDDTTKYGIVVVGDKLRFIVKGFRMILR